MPTHDNAGIAAWRFKLKGEIHSYDDCVRFACGHKPIDASSIHTDWALGPQMVLRLNPIDYYAVVLYETEIIRYYLDDTFSVDNGGFNTLTTTYRLSAVLPDGFWNAFHRHKQLGLRGKGGELWPLDHSKRINIKTGEIA